MSPKLFPAGTTYLAVVASLCLIGSWKTANAEPHRKSDLLLYYPFDDGGGDIATDASGNGRDGQIIGSPNFVEGKLGQAIDLDTGNKLRSNDASGQHVRVPSFAIGPEATFSFWIYRDSQPNWARVIDFANGPNLANILIAPVGTGNNLRVGFRDTNVGDRDYTVNNLFENQKWAHFAVAFEDRGTNTSHIRVYKDGLLHGTKTDSSPIPAFARKNQYIGRSAWNDQYADYKLDEFRIYGVALTTPEIALIHGVGNGAGGDSPPEFTVIGDPVVTLRIGEEFTDPGAVAADAEDGTLDVATTTADLVTRQEDLIGHWRFDDSTSNDSSGNGYDGVHSAEDIYTDDSPFETGRGINLAGNKYVTVSDGASQTTFDGGSEFTISVWVKGWPDGNWEPFISKRGEGGQGWQLRRRGADADQIAFTMRGPGNDDWAVQKNINDEKWHHLVGTFGDGKRSLYIDGVLAGEEDRAGAVNPTGSQLVFGARDNSANASNPPNIGNQASVSLDDVRFYGAALNAADVAAIHNDGKGDSIGPLDTSKTGTWIITYSATDSAGHRITAQRVIKVVDPAAPVITLAGEDEATHEGGADFPDPGATVADAAGNALDAAGIVVTGTVDAKSPGVYTLRYAFTDTEGRAAQTVERTVTVTDTKAPEVTLAGEETIRHRLGNPFRDPGATAEDLVDGSVLVDSSEFTWNQLSVNGYQLSGRDDTWVNLDFNGGLIEQTPKGTSVFKGGPFGVGINIETDAVFQDMDIGITRNDDFQTLIHGVFRPKADGDHTLGIDWPDDRGSFWIDLDRDGRFEKEGNLGNESMNEGTQVGYKTVSLKRGEVYDVAIAHVEYAGGSRIISYVTIPGHVRQILSPVFSEQSGMWGTRNPIDVNTEGTYTITYITRDAAGNEATVTRKVIVEEPQEPPVLTLKGGKNLRHPVGEDFTDPGVEITDAAGTPIDGAEPVISGDFKPAATGIYILAYDYANAQGAANTLTRQVEVYDNKPPTIVLTGEAEIEIFQGTVFTDPGFAATDNSGLDINVASTADIPREGLQLHLDASYFSALLNDGDSIPAWPDLSGNNRHASDTRGEPTLSARAINGHPAVHFDVDDFMATTHHFGNRRYSIFTVSQFDGGTAGRLISSRDVNYLLGYWNGREDVAHLEGWVINQNEGPFASTDPHLYTATNTGANHSQFYSDGVNLTTNASPNGRIGKIQFGGWQVDREPSSGYVAEVIFYDRVLTHSERLGVETFLNGKYGLNGHAETTKLDVNTLGTYDITYVAADPSGNVAVATRVIKVVPDPSVPVITLNGDTEMFHEAGTEFNDPGAMALFIDGDAILILDDTLMGKGAVDTTKLGIYTLAYEYSTAEGKTASTVTRTVVVADNAGPVITLNGDAVVRIGVGNGYQDAGATASDVFTGEAGVTVQSSNPKTGYQPGLIAGGLSGNMSFEPNPGNLGVDTEGPTLSESTAKPPWKDNYTIVYTGQIFDEDGKISFMENIDDKAWLTVNGQKLLDNQAWNQVSQKSVDFGESGWFEFELRISNGGGGAGKVGQMGFGYDPDGGSNWILPRNSDGPAGLFRIKGFDYNSLDTSKAGTYTYTYTSSDTFGNSSTAIRTIVVTEDLGKPFITLNGEQELTHEAGVAYVDPGAKAFLGDGTEANGDLKGTGDVDGLKPGTYNLTYKYDDDNGDSAEPLTRTVIVVDTTPPAITLGEFKGNTDFVRLFQNQEFTDPGAMGKDVLDGDVAVFSDLAEIPNALLSHAYTFGFNENQLDFSADTSLFEQQSNAIHLFRRELKFGGDSEFRNANPGISRNDNFQSLWHGYFTAKRGGEFVFDVTRTDDRSTVWIDIDGDGIFERDGDGGDERITWGNGSVRFSLEKGRYRVAIGHIERGGVSSIEIRLQTPEDAGPFDLTLINPIDPEQAGIWSTPANPPVDTAVIGRRTIRYYAVDKAGNFAVAERVIIVDEDKLKPVLALLGDKIVKQEAGNGYKDDGVELYDYQGNKLDAAQVVVSNLPDGSMPGEYVVTYDFTDDEGHRADQVTRLVKLPDTTPPVITLSGINPVTIRVDSEYQDPGATAVDVVDGELLVSSNLTLPMHGMLAWWTFDDGDGTIAKDVLDKYHGELVNFQGSEWDDGQIKGALHFNANNQNNQYMNVPSFEFGGAFSVAAWVQYDKTENWSRIIDFGHAANNHNVLLANVGGGTQGAWQIRIGGNNRDLRFNNFWEVNNWVHAAATVTEGGIMRLYKNGQQVAENANGHAPAVQTRANHYVGRSNWGNDRYFRGYMDELILYQRAITQGEVNRIMKGVQPLDTFSAGEHTVTYITVDSSGNQATATRKVLIVEEPIIPEITLKGDVETEHLAGTPFEDPGVTVSDSEGNDLDASTVKVSGEVDVNKPGDYVLVYDFTDAAGNAAASAVRKVKVVDETGPVITLTGGETFKHQIGNDWVEPGVTAVDGVDGEVEVINSLVRKNQILHSGFILDPTTGNRMAEGILNLDGNGGLLVEMEMPAGQKILTGGPRGQGLFFNGDNDFMNAGVGIDRNDNYQNLFTAHFHSKKKGVYEFGVENPDDRSTVWVDLDGDGVFETDGDNGSEWINGGYRYNYREVELGVGYYKVAITHLEWGGGSRVDSRFRAISGFGPRQRVRINPSDPAQDGLWVQYDPVNVKKKGEYTITYTAIDAAGNTTTATRNVVVDSNPDAPVIVLNGDKKLTHSFGTPYEDVGASVEDVDGNALDATGLKTTGEVNSDKTGEYVIAYTFTDANGVAAKTVRRTVIVADTTPPVITLVGGEEITHFVGTPFVDPGVTALDNYDGELRVASSELFPTEGLVLHLDAGEIFGVEDGVSITNWMDLSQAGNHASDVAGEPTYVLDGINGLPGVQFDGTSSLAVSEAVGNRYTILTVSRLLGSRNARLLTSKDLNWLLGYHGNFEDCYHPVNGWVTDRTVPATANPHIYIATSTGANYKRFWSDRGELTFNASRANGAIGIFQMGAWQGMREPSAGIVSEVLIYDRTLKSSERLSLQTRLSIKYGFTEVRQGIQIPVNRDVVGDYVIQYSVEDSNGNLSTVRRTVHVVEDPDAPVITLEGGDFVNHEMGMVFTDPGYSLKAADGTELDMSLVNITGQVDGSKSGIYKLTYNYSSGAKLARERVRYVTVADTQGPVITLSGDAVVKLEIGNEYVETGFSATDAADGEVPAYTHLERLPNMLDVNGYMEGGRNNNMMNFDQGGGLLSLQPVGVTRFSGDITALNGDAAFRGLIPAINKNDDYQLVFHGFFNAKADGAYEFGLDNADDRCSFWIDLDQDDIFESSGDNGNEVVFTNFTRGGWKTYNLTEGVYRVAIGFMEFGGGAWVRPRVRLPGGGRLAIHPSNSNQAGYWFSNPSSFIDVNTAGTYTVEYSAYDSSGNSSLVTRTIVVVEDASLPFISLNKGLEVVHEAGTHFTDPGATVKDLDGKVLKDDLAGEGTVDSTTLGEYTLTYNFTDGNGNAAEPATLRVIVVDSSAPTIELKPDANGDTETVRVVVGQPYEDPGLTATDIVDKEVHVWNSLQIPTSGLTAYYRLDEITGLVAHDDWSGHHGTLHGMTDDNHVDGKNGKALDFNGVKADAQHMVAPPFNIGGDFTFAAWVNYDKFNNWSRIIDFGNAANNHNVLVANRGGGSQIAWEVRIGGNNRNILHPNFWELNKWMHVVATVSKDGVLRVYKNGDQAAENLAGHAPQDMKRTGQYIGRSHWANDGFFDGQMDDLLFYRRVLSPEEIKLLANGESSVINTSEPATHTITYVASDDSGNIAKVKRTIIVEPDPASPVITLNGEEFFYLEGGTDFTDPGATAKDTTGKLLEEGILSKDTFDTKTPGKYVLSYVYVTPDGKTAVPVNRTIIVEDTTAPVLTLKGKNPVTVQLGADFIDFGVTVTDAVDGDIIPSARSSKPTAGYVPGLRTGGLNGNMSFEPNPGNFGIDADGPTLSESTAKPPWKDNYTIMYTGQIYDADGKVSFMENIDDKAWLTVNGEKVLDNAGWNEVSQGTTDFGEGGWFDFELRISNGGGGAGKVGNMGFGYDPEGGTNWILPRNSDGQANLFRLMSQRHNTVGAGEEGEFTITYTAVDAAGNEASVTRSILVVDDPTIPVIAFINEEDADLTIEAGAKWVDPGVTVTDRKGNALDASKIVINGILDSKKLGVQHLYYDYTDDSGKEAVSLKRKITVVDTTAPSIELTGGDRINVLVGGNFTDPGSVVTDNLDTDLVATVKLEGSLDGLVAHWKFDDGAEDKATDSVGNLQGTLVNFESPDDAWVDGKIGKALKLDGANDHVILPASDVLDLQALTISVWINATDYAQDAFLFEKTTNGQMNTQYSLHLQSSDQVNFRLVNGGNLNDTSIQANLNLQSEDWNHVVFTFDGQLKAAYVDGQLIANMPAALNINQNPAGSSIIGAASPGQDYYFNGLIDDLRIYDRAIPEDKISDLLRPASIDTSQKTALPYVLLYTAIDSNGNIGTARREVIVSNDSNPPVITLQGDPEVTVKLGVAYEDAGATAEDAEDGILTPFIETNGTEEVDTSKAGVHIVTYDLTDFSGNKAAQVTRKVTVMDSNPFTEWVLNGPLADLPAEQQALEADPDADEIPNLLEYALGGNPRVADRAIVMPMFDISGGRLVLTYVRLKASYDPEIIYKPMLTTSLGDPAGWDESAVNITGALQGVSQANLPDGKAFASSNYERVEVSAKTDIDSETAGKQFLRVVVEK